MTEVEKEALVFIAPWGREWMRQFGYADLDKGKKERLMGANAAKSKVVKVDPDWLAAAEELVLRALDNGETVCSDEVTYMLPVPLDCHPNAWGSVWMGLSRKGRIHCVDYKMTSRPAGHAGLVRVWAAGPGGDDV